LSRYGFSILSERWGTADRDIAKGSVRTHLDGLIRLCWTGDFAKQITHVPQLRLCIKPRGGIFSDTDLQITHRSLEDYRTARARAETYVAVVAQKQAIMARIDPEGGTWLSPTVVNG